MKKMNLIFLLLFAVITNNYSQSVIKGRVVDKSGIAVPYTSVRLLDMDSTFVSGVATDTLGVFQFENIQNGQNFRLAFTSIGYDPILLSIHTSRDVFEVPLVILTPSVTLLDEVEIKAQSIIRSGEKVLIIPEKRTI
ncbi:carboxypeptidase-like regulatory domain-containing protein, partial [Bacteroides sp. KG68]